MYKDTTNIKYKLCWYKRRQMTNLYLQSCSIFKSYAFLYLAIIIEQEKKSGKVLYNHKKYV